MKSFEPIITKKIAFPNNGSAAGAPMFEIMSCLLFAKLSICASKLSRPPYASYTNLTVYVNLLIAVHLSPNTMKILNQLF